jgi:pyruvate/oxaloacetate carboxyltransferase
VAWVAALVYPHVHVTGNMLETRTGLAVKASVDIIAKSAAAVSAGVLRDAAKAEVARLEQEQADQGNPSTAQN